MAAGVEAMVVPGSGVVKKQAEAEGLDKVFRESGFDWREPGCSMCLGMNPDRVGPQQRCASTSNRNFEDRQGVQARTHLMSPAMAAAAAVAGTLKDVRTLLRPSSENKGNGAPTNSLSFNQREFIPAEPATEAPVAVSGGAAGFASFTTLDSAIAAPFRRENVDTDCILPKQFLKTIKRTGLGKAAFFGIRYEDDGETELNTFVLNQEPYRAAEVLVTGENFGCGSSREHAPWALLDFGIRCVIAPSIADIFYNNCFKNSMLPIILTKDKVEVLMADAEEKRKLTIDLPQQRVIRDNGEAIHFEVDGFRKHCLVNGLDDIGLTMQKRELITAFEATRSARHPWLDGPGRGRGDTELRITVGKGVRYYMGLARGFLAGMPADGDRPARPPAARIVLSATGNAIEHAARVAQELERGGDAVMCSLGTALLEMGPRSSNVPRISITLEARAKAQGITPATLAGKDGDSCGCASKATEW